jgi:hypothetical protein
MIDARLIIVNIQVKAIIISSELTERGMHVDGISIVIKGHIREKVI